MARKRMISPNVWQDPDFGKLSADGKVFFFGLVSNSDDEGRLRGNSAYLKSIIFVYDNYSLQRMQKIRDEVVSKMKNVLLYKVNEEEYIQLKNWDRYQKQRDDRTVASDFPAPEKGEMSDTCPPNVRQVPAEVKLGKEKLSKEKVREEKEAIFSHWNSLKIIQHKKLSADAEKEIEKVLESVSSEDLLAAMNVYGQILSDPKKYWWTHRWNLFEFLKRGVKQFQGKNPEDYLIGRKMAQTVDRI